MRGADFCAELYWKSRNKLMSNCWPKKKSKRYECVKIDEPVCACVCVCGVCGVYLPALQRVESAKVKFNCYK